MYVKIELKAPQMSQTSVMPYDGVPWTFSMRTSHLSVNKFQNLVKVSYIGTTSVECKKNYFSTCWSQLVYLVTNMHYYEKKSFFSFSNSVHPEKRGLLFCFFLLFIKLHLLQGCQAVTTKDQVPSKTIRGHYILFIKLHLIESLS